MIKRPHGTALLVFLSLVATAATARLGAQTVDSTRRWSLFGGMAPVDYLNTTEHIGDNFEIGGSGDFRLGAFPLPLRATLAFSRVERPYFGPTLKIGTLALDAVARPLPRVFGTQLYLLGGLGVATRAGYFSAPGNAIPLDQWLLQRSSYDHPRQNWMFLEGGAGLDVGRMFLQVKIQGPVASDGPMRAPLSIGFRF